MNGWAMVHRARRVHLVGIGGSGMSGIAEVLLGLGHGVTGSDLASNPAIARLRENGAVVYEGHDPSHVDDVDVVVVSSAVRPDNPEVRAARARRIPVIKRAEMLAELMRLAHGIVVAGSHGKTTTTSMLAQILVTAGLDPTAVIGGRPNGWASSSRVGRGGLLVAEADESDGSFLHLTPTFALITNVDPEHLDHYGGDLRALDDAFVELTERVPFWGSVTLCVDDPGVRRIRSRVNRPRVLYGTSEEADLRLVDVLVDGTGTTFSVQARGDEARTGRIAAFGRHNALNATGAVAVARELGVSVPTSLEALSEFRGVDRRFSLRGEAGGVRVVDDYAHHPTEIRATLAAARSAHPEGKIRVGFQPHRFTRTRDHADDFAACFEDADQVVLAPIYPAGEAPLEGIDSEWLAHRVGERKEESEAVPSLDQLALALADAAAPGDLILLLGAGDVHRLAPRVLERIASKLGNGRADGGSI